MLYDKDYIDTFCIIEGIRIKNIDKNKKEDVMVYFY